MKEQVGQCDICSRTFSSFKRLRKHWRRKHREVQAISCCFCDFIIGEESLFAKHKKEFHPNDRMACEFCAYTTRKWSRLKKHHMNVHVALSKTNVANSFEHRIFKNETSVSSCRYPTDHTSISSNFGNVEVQCSILKEKENVSAAYEMTAESYHIMYKTGRTLQLNHKAKSTKPSKLQNLSGQKCECGLENCKTCQLYHDDKQTAREPSTESFVCDVCQKSFASSSHCSSHKVMHTIMKCYICCHCDKGFRSAEEYDLHLIKHFRKKPFKCETCEKFFSTKSYLKVHIKRHTGELNYKCMNCNYATNRNSGLKEHKRIHSNTRPYKCQVCDYAAVCQTAFIHHIRTHSGEKPYCCNLCDKRFTQRIILINHKKCIHLA